MIDNQLLVEVHDELRQAMKNASHTAHNLFVARRELEEYKTTLDDYKLAAVANWNKEAKAPVNPANPWNDGSNDDKRELKARELFADEYRKVDEIREQINALELAQIDNRLSLDLATLEWELQGRLIDLEKLGK